MSDHNLIDCGITQGAYLEGDQLDDEAKEEIKLGRALKNKRESPVENRHKLIVLSQSCDINSKREKSIELATARSISKTSPEVQKTRNLKKLHLLVDDEWWQIESELITVVPKTVLLSIEDLQARGNIGQDNLDILTQWRVNRYTREPLPDKFNKALFSEYLHNSDNGLDGFLKANRSKIFGIYAFVDPVEQEDADTYLVSLTMVLMAHCNNDDVTELASEFKKHINALDDIDNGLSMLQADKGGGYHPDLTNIEMVCLPSEFSFEDAMRMHRLTLDFLCWDDADSEETV